MKSAVSFTLSPLGCRPRPLALHRLGLQAEERQRSVRVRPRGGANSSTTHKISEVIRVDERRWGVDDMELTE